MHPIYIVYILLTYAILLAVFPAFWIYTRVTGRLRAGQQERFGFVPHQLIHRLKGSPRIWLHAVSLGEVKVAVSIKKALDSLWPRHTLIVSVFTEHGYHLAKESLPNTPVIYAPYDFSFAVRKALNKIRPDLLIFLETEIWPAWLTEARKKGVKIALLNGRISERSIGRYLKFGFFFREILKKFDLFSMIREEDALRIGRMGAEARSIAINGNAKYDLLAGLINPAFEEEMHCIFNLTPLQQVFVAGSTRTGEEGTILKVYLRILKEFPDTLLVIAPRHIERTPRIENLLRSLGFEYQLRTDFNGIGQRRTAPVVIMNTYGELFKLYSIGTIIFCGASLVPMGGQNPLEPAVWGKVVFYGPSMEDFLDAKAMLEKEQAGIEVSNADEFSAMALRLLRDPGERLSRGARAGARIRSNQGAAFKHVKALTRLIG